VPQYAAIGAGDTAPVFHQRTSNNPRYAFESAAGRYILLGFFVTAADDQGQRAYAAMRTRPDLFDDAKIAFFGVSVDPNDEAEKRVAQHLPGYRVIWDFDTHVSRLYGSMPMEREPNERNVQARRFWVVLDPTLRVMQVLDFEDDGSDIDRLFGFLGSLPPVALFSGSDLQAPVLLLPDVFEPEFCEQLIGLHDKTGGKESGFMREVDGKSVIVNDHSHKRRRDFTITDTSLIGVLQAKIKRRIVPQIMKAHQFEVTRMERYLVGCYTAEDGGHFQAHRDNTTKGTAHRRFAVSINLNSDFDGGELSFPEYGPRSFKPAPGGAVVFSCSLLHAASKVTRGRRYAFLPFLYDDKAAEIRAANNAFLGEGVKEYQTV
jgi:peroxiredoxin